MEVRVEAAEGQIVPQDLFLSVRVGANQKQARFTDKARTFKFTDLGDGLKNVGRIEVFKRVGIATVDFSDNLDGQIQDVEIECRDLDTSHLQLRLAHSNGDAPPKSVRDEKARDRLVEAQRYMQHHQLEDLLSESLREVIRERPKDPHCYLSAEILKRSNRLPSVAVNTQVEPISPKITRANWMFPREETNEINWSVNVTMPEATMPEPEDRFKEAKQARREAKEVLGHVYTQISLGASGSIENARPGSSRSAATQWATLTYIGEWEGSRREGQGVQVFPDGSKYDGQWCNDRAEGRGRFTHADGSVYEGEWLDGKANGPGTLSHVNGTKYSGQWKDDRKDGVGKQEWGDGATYEGQFSLDFISGKGTFSWSDGASYTGDFVDHAITGEGTYVWNDGRKYTGQWVNYRMHGKGFFTWKDGRCFEGQYHYDLKHGSGVLRWPDGRSYEGIWKGDTEHGAGVYTFSNGVKCPGQWIQGNWTWDDPDLDPPE